ncbi:MAG: TylF/MycF/NovP-related O-methyltransferase [Gammaproteobacteria bacterium]
MGKLGGLADKLNIHITSDLGTEMTALNARLGGSKIVMGRDITAGYLRGWGLQFGKLLSAAKADPVYQKCIKSVSGRTIIAEAKAVNIYLMIRFYLAAYSEGSIFEFGAYRGGSSMFMALLCKELDLNFHIYALDTYEGMPETDKDVDLHSKGDFANVDLVEIQSFAGTLGLDNITFLKGYFQDTAEKALASAKPVVLAHIDCDIYEAVKYSYSVVKPCMHKNGGYLVFDDPLVGSCLGAFQAVEELVIGRDHLFAEQVYPHLVYRYPPLR